MATLEGAASAARDGVHWFKLITWTLFALAGPLVFLAMRNYLGVAITGGIGVFIGLFAYGPGVAQFRGRRALRAALVVQGLGLGLFGGYVLSRPALPWTHVAGSTRTSLVLADGTGVVHALEFTEHGARFFTHTPGTGAWGAEPFSGYLASSLWLGPQSAFVLAPEDRSDAVWWHDARPGTQWHERSGFGFPCTFAAGDDALLIAARNKLWRVASAEAAPVELPDMPVTTVCALGSQALAVRSRSAAAGHGRVWRSTDGGARFTEVPDASLPGKLCALSRDGWAWIAEEGTFRGDLAVSAPGGAFVVRSPPAPRIEALVVNPDDGKEAWIGVWGAGVFRSVDAGASWRQMGLEGSEVSALVVDFRRSVAYAGTGSGVFARAY